MEITQAYNTTRIPVHPRDKRVEVLSKESTKWWKVMVIVKEIWYFEKYLKNVKKKESKNSWQWRVLVMDWEAEESSNQMIGGMIYWCY